MIAAAASAASAEGWPLLLKATLLGLVEGATEFIPVSSTGHLIVVSDWLGFLDERAKTFGVFIQLGAILAVAWLYRGMLWRTVARARDDEPSRRLLVNLAIAFVPAAAVGFLIHDWIKAYLFNPLTVAWALVVGGVIILLIEWWRPRARVERMLDVPYGTALGIGLAQVLALFPGTSRSGATIMGAYVLGLSRRAATEFSFLLALPIMVAATLYDLAKSWSILTAADLPLFAVGFAVSFLSALVVIRGFLAFVANRTFTAFAWYRIAFGAALLALYWRG